MFRRALLLLFSILIFSILVFSSLIPLGSFAIGRPAVPIEAGSIGAAPIEHDAPVPINTFPAIVKVLKSSNVRAGPGTEYPVISGARPGQRLTVYGCNADCSWYLLADDCWIAAFLVKPEQTLAPQVQVVPQTPVAPPISGTAPLPTIVVSIPITVEGTPIQTTRCPQIAAQVNTYAGPGTFYPVVDTRPAGECVAVVGRNATGDWLQLFHGAWIEFSAILYAEPIEYLPVTDRIFTATPEPTHTPFPTATPTATPTPPFPEITTVGEWVAAGQEQKAATAMIWAQRYISAGEVAGDAGMVANQLLTCVDITLRDAAAILGESYSAQAIADGCSLVLN